MAAVGETAPRRNGLRRERRASGGGEAPGRATSFEISGRHFQPLPRALLDSIWQQKPTLRNGATVAIFQPPWRFLQPHGPDFGTMGTKSGAFDFPTLNHKSRFPLHEKRLRLACPHGFCGTLVPACVLPRGTSVPGRALSPLPETTMLQLGAPLPNPDHHNRHPRHLPARRHRQNRTSVAPASLPAYWTPLGTPLSRAASSASSYNSDPSDKSANSSPPPDRKSPGLFPTRGSAIPTRVSPRRQTTQGYPAPRYSL